jgi:hypothetical protein
MLHKSQGVAVVDISPIRQAGCTLGMALAVPRVLIIEYLSITFQHPRSLEGIALYQWVQMAIVYL